MMTDDPGTVDKGEWEINVAWIGVDAGGSSAHELPLLDINYGLTEHVQLKYEVAHVSAAGHNAIGNSLAGVKWRFYDAGENGWQISTYPQVGFHTPGSDADELGLAESGSALLLPLQFMRQLDALAFGFDLGYEFHDEGDDAWFGGFVVGHEFRPRVELMGELHSEYGQGFHQGVVSLDAGSRVLLTEHFTLLMSVGTDVHGPEEERADAFGYVGLQITF